MSDYVKTLAEQHWELEAFKHGWKYAEKEKK